MALPIAAAGQTQPLPPAPPQGPGTYYGTAGAGLALTSGNSDTSTFNITFDVTRDARTRNVLRATGLYLRGQQNDELVANRLSVTLRDQFTLTSNSFFYGQLDYLQDTFKLIDSLVAPTVGFGYKFTDSDRTKSSIDAGIGAVWEKNPGIDVRTSLGFTASEKLQHAITASATVKHAAIALLKADDLADGLYTISVGLSTKISERLQLSVDLLDTYKNRPPTSATVKNDIAVVTAVTAKF